MSRIEFKPLGEICLVRKGTTITKKKAIPGNIPVVAGGMNPTYFHNEANRIANTITISGSGASAGYVNFWEQPIFASDCSTVEVSGDTEPKFVFYYLKHMQDYIYANFRKGAAQPHVYAKDIAFLPFPITSFNDQKRVAAILEKADAIRRKRLQVIKLANSFLDSLFLDTFGDPLVNPKGWPVCELQDVCIKITDGVHHKPEYVEEGVPFISVKDITTGELKFEKTKFVSQVAHQKMIKRCHPEYLDLLYTKVGATYGRPAIVDTRKEFSLYVSVALIKPDKEKIDPYFLRYMLSNPAMKSQADRSVKGIGVPDLHLVEIKGFKIVIPAMSVQKEFVKKVEKMNGKIDKINQSLHLADNIFGALSQLVFRVTSL